MNLIPNTMAMGDHTPHGLVIQRVSDIEAKPIAWLWDGRMALGKITVLAGDPGLGKSQITAAMAAVITTGQPWPDKTEAPEIGDVLFVCAEDDPSDTLKPRLMAAGADLQRCHVLQATLEQDKQGSRYERQLDLSKDLPKIAKMLEANPNIRLVVIDPITAYMGGLDQNKNADVRKLMSELSTLLARHQVATLLVSHLSKGDKRKPLERVLGSTGLVAAARAVWLVVADPENPERRFFGCAKNNLGSDNQAHGLAYSIKPHKLAENLVAPAVAWENEPVKVDLATLMGGMPKTEQRPNASQEAMDFLSSYLADAPKEANEIFAAAKAVGITYITLKRAKSSLGVNAFKDGFANSWKWQLPKKIKPTQEDHVEGDPLEKT